MPSQDIYKLSLDKARSSPGGNMLCKIYATCVVEHPTVHKSGCRSQRGTLLVLYILVLGAQPDEVLEIEGGNFQSKRQYIFLNITQIASKSIGFERPAVAVEILDMMTVIMRRTPLESYRQSRRVHESMPTVGKPLIPNPDGERAAMHKLALKSPSQHWDPPRRLSLTQKLVPRSRDIWRRALMNSTQNYGNMMAWCFCHRESKQAPPCS